MAFVDMNKVHIYQPGGAAGRSKVRRQAVSSSRITIAYGEVNILPALEPVEERSWIPLDDDPIEFLDMTDPLSGEPSSLSQWPAPDFDGTRKGAENTSNGLSTSCTYYGRNSVEEDDYLPTVKEILSGARNVQERPQSTGSSGRHVTGGSEGNLEDAAKNDHNTVASSGSSEGESNEKLVPIGDNRLEDRNTQDAQQEADNLTSDGGNKKREAVRPDKAIGTHDHHTHTKEYLDLRKKPVFKVPPTLKPSPWDNRAKKSGKPGDPLVIQDQDPYSSSDGASEEQNENQGSLSTPSTSVAGSEAGYSTLDQRYEQDIPNTSPLKRNTLSSTPGEGLTLDPSTDGDKKSPWKHQEADADGKEEHEENYNGDGGEKTTPLLGLTKKRGPSAVEGKSTSERPAKRRRRLSPTLAVQDQNLDNQAATSPLPLEQAWEQGDKAQVEELEWGVKKILDKRETISGTECKVRWEDTWLPIDELGHARKLLREFEAQRRAQHGHKRGRPPRTPLSSCQ